MFTPPLISLVIVQEILPVDVSRMVQSVLLTSTRLFGATLTRVLLHLRKETSLRENLIALASLVPLNVINAAKSPATSVGQRPPLTRPSHKIVLSPTLTMTVELVQAVGFRG